MSRFLLALVLGACCCHVEFVSAAGYLDQNTYTSQGKAQKVRRERNLDHWDSDTLAFYLDEYQGFDCAVLFYAQWDSNSRALAPYWAQTASKLEAGSSSSRLVMSLFDCELNAAHSELCRAVGITHYPTMLFIGSGPYHDTDPFTKAIFGSKSAGIMGEAPVSNTVKFQGNWQYVDSIIDWIRTMQALSNWHTWSTEGFGKRLRNFFLPHKANKAALPIGIPGQLARSAAAGTSGGSASSDNSLRTQNLEREVEKLKDLAESYQKTVDRGNNMLDKLLVGSTSKTKDGQDMFSLLHQQNAWNKSKQALPEVLRSCVAELSLDYCQRISQKVAEDLIEELDAQGMSVDEMLALPDLEQRIIARVGEAEPYCELLDTCIVSDFAEPECRPERCPFRNPVACQYLSSCLDPALQQEYAEALGLSLKTGSSQKSADTSSASEKMASEKTASEKKEKKKWGM